MCLQEHTRANYPGVCAYLLYSTSSLTLRTSYLSVLSERSGRIVPQPKYCLNISKTWDRSLFWLTEKLGRISQPKRCRQLLLIETQKQPSPSAYPLRYDSISIGKCTSRSPAYDSKHRLALRPIYYLSVYRISRYGVTLRFRSGDFPRYYPLFDATSLSVATRLGFTVISRYGLVVDLPDKEFRYLRTVIVTAAVYRGFDQELAPHQLTFRHRAGVTPYTSTFVFAECCVFIKQSQPPFHCNPIGLRK